MIKNAKHILFLGVFSIMMLQPYHFVVDTPMETPSMDSVHASYVQLIEQTQQQDGALIYDTVSVDEDRQTSITYRVAPGDSLSSIAKDFGTTVGTLVEVNNLKIGTTLRPGQKLIIAYTDHYVYTIEGTLTLQEFSEKYNLNIADMMSLNYIDAPEKQLEEGQELVLPLTRREAQIKWLVTPEEFVPLELPTTSNEESTAQENVELMDEASPEEGKPDEFIQRNIEESQVVITPEQTEQHLKDLEQEKIETVQKAEEERRAREEAEKAAAKLPIQEVKQWIKAPTVAEPAVDPAASCNENQCYHDGKCRGKPANAVCALQDPSNAWVCKPWFVDTGKSCVEPSKLSTKKELTEQWEEQITRGVVKQWYFNTRKEWKKTKGWAPGNCTDYVNLRLQQHLDKETSRRWNAKYRFSAAEKAGVPVGKQPKYSSIVVFNGWIGAARRAGHVAIVLEVSSNGTMLIEEGNYVGLYIASQRRVSVNDKNIVWYIYP